jgi:hypothetical protein
MVREKGEWYQTGERDNPTIKRRIIDGKYYSRTGIFTNKREADIHANNMRIMYDVNVRVIPLVLWGKLFGYPDSIPSKKQCYVVFRHWNK